VLFQDGNYVLAHCGQFRIGLHLLKLPGVNRVRGFHVCFLEKLASLQYLC
jgi:hypothetical protein